MSGIRLTRLTTLNGHAGKTMRMVDSALDIDGAPDAYEFDGETLNVSSLEHWAEILQNTNTDELYLLGNNTVPGNPNQFEMTYDKEVRRHFGKSWAEEGGNYVFSRTRSNFQMGHLGLFDYDVDSFTPEHCVFRSPEEYFDCMSRICPPLANAKFVVKPSSSANLWLGDTELKGDSPKFHAYFTIQDPTDWERFIEALVVRTWNAGYGWYKLSSSDSNLPRQLFDSVIYGPERILYEAKPLLLDGITQQRSEVRILGTNDRIDTRAYPDLTEEERIEFCRRKGDKVTRKKVTQNGKTTLEVQVKTGVRTTVHSTLDLDERVIKSDRRTVATISEFLASGAKEWRVYSGRRWDIEEFLNDPYDHGPSAQLTRTDDGFCILTEYSANETYLLSPHSRHELRRRRMQAEREKVEREVPDEAQDFNAPLLSEMRHARVFADRYKRNHIFLGCSEQEKAVILGTIPSGKAVHTYSTNAALKNGARLWGGTPYFSKSQKLLDRKGIKIKPEKSMAPWIPDTVTDSDAVAAMVKSGKFKSKRAAQAYWDDLGEPVGLDGDAHITLARLKFLLLGDEAKQQVSRKTVVFHEPFREEAILLWRLAKQSDEVREAQQEHVIELDGDEWLKRPRQFTMGKHVGQKLIFTDDKHTARYLSQILDMPVINMDDLREGKDPRGLVYMMESRLAHKQNGDAFAEMMHKHPSWKVVSDKIDADANLKAEIRRFSREDVVIRLSIPHESLTMGLETTKVALNSLTESKVKNRVAELASVGLSEQLALNERQRIMKSTLNRLLGQICGDYWQGNKVLVIVPPGYAEQLNEWCDFVVSDGYPDTMLDMKNFDVVQNATKRIAKVKAWIAKQDRVPSWSDVYQKFHLDRVLATRVSSSADLKEELFGTT